MKDFATQTISIAIIGAGVMGRGIAQIAATAGIPVILHDLDAKVVADAVSFIEKMLNRAHEKGRLSAEQLESSKACIQASSDLKNLSDCDLVIEAIIENIEIKQSLFKELEDIVSEDCILATNTSSLSVTHVAASCDKPERVAGFHFFNPVPLMKLVEVIDAIRTSAEVVEQLEALCKRLGHTPVVVEDSPGFLVNHAGRAHITEGLRILYENICDAQLVDSVMRDCVNFRMGPFELMDLTGLDVTFPASEQVYMQYFQEARVRPTPLQRRRYIAGLLGRKTGEGFYKYEDGNKLSAAEAQAPQINPESTFWIHPEISDLADKIATTLADSDIRIDKGPSPADDSIILLTPLGLDATTSAVEHDLPAQRCVAVDALFMTDKRVTLMANPALDESCMQQCWAAFAESGRAVSVIRDSGGFVAQRIVACIVNIACEIAQQGIARPADIDTAARLGLGYPQGPLALGDECGADRILRILDNLQTVYGDPRYRPSPWLKRRAQLKLSLLSTEQA
ncbi:MAG: 3-hydroxyacyl-CoA dehydrogenase [Gammaproteobacteria bacterium]|nr:3-hydroxyacyl-CoA dehydrogenase [Gammaproteobacteria bacterium]